MLLRSSLIWVCTVCPGLSVRKLRSLRYPQKYYGKACQSTTNYLYLNWKRKMYQKKSENSNSNISGTKMQSDRNTHRGGVFLLFFFCLFVFVVFFWGGVFLERDQWALMNFLGIQVNNTERGGGGVWMHLWLWNLSFFFFYLNVD